MGETALPTVEREAVRAIILSPERELLLLHKRFRDWSFWITPGGGIAPGETATDCLRRELHEELGVEQFALGPLIFRCHYTMNWRDRRVHQREHYYAIELPKFTPTMNDPVERLSVDEMRWWTQRELAEAREECKPRRLVAMVATYLRDGPPTDPDALPFLLDE